jgi:tRNA-guanine family transglycosylase
MIDISGKQLVTPTYFPSISGAATRLDLKQLIELCLASGYPRVLVSAFDLFQFPKEKIQSLKKKLQEFQSENKFIFLDSGTFEKYWLHDSKWNFERYKKMIQEIQCDFYASFDDIVSPGENVDSIAGKIITNSLSSSKLNQNSQCLTVFHGGPGKFSEVISKVELTQPHLCNAISIPERECGDSIEIRLRTINKIRKILDERRPNSFIHVLGCGNLISMALYTLVGADSFDSVDWSRWLLNRKDCQFTDITHLSLQECQCKACARTDLQGVVKAIFHNLLFYQEFLASLRNAIKTKTEIEFLESYLETGTISKIVKLFSDNGFDKLID